MPFSLPTRKLKNEECKSMIVDSVYYKVEKALWIAD